MFIELDETTSIYTGYGVKVTEGEIDALLSDDVRHSLVRESTISLLDFCEKNDPEMYEYLLNNLNNQLCSDLGEFIISSYLRNDFVEKLKDNEDIESKLFYRFFPFYKTLLAKKIKSKDIESVIPNTDCFYLDSGLIFVGKGVFLENIDSYEQLLYTENTEFIGLTFSKEVELCTFIYNENW